MMRNSKNRENVKSYIRKASWDGENIYQLSDQGRIKKKKEMQTRKPYPAKLSLRNKAEIKYFSGKQKMRECTTN